MVESDRVLTSLLLARISWPCRIAKEPCLSESQRRQLPGSSFSLRGGFGKNTISQSVLSVSCLQKGLTEAQCAMDRHDTEGT